MKKCILLALILSLYPVINLNAQEKKADKPQDKTAVGVQNSALPETATWGRSGSIGIPVGMYNDDIVVGLDFAYPVIDTIVLRLNAHLLVDRYSVNELTVKGIRIRRQARPVLYPSLSFIGRSPMIFNIRLYGGATVGLAYSPNYVKPVPHVEGFAGAELYAHRHHAFFIEVGGGGVISQKDVDFSRGVLVTGGTRFYF